MKGRRVDTSFSVPSSFPFSFFHSPHSHSHSCLPFCPLPPSTFSQWDSASFKSFHSLELFYELQLPFFFSLSFSLFSFLPR